MSIINDALKKVQKNIPTSNSTLQPSKRRETKNMTTVSPPPNIPPSPRKTQFSLWIGLIILVLLWFAIIITHKPLSPKLTTANQTPSLYNPEAIGTESTENAHPSPIFEAEPLIQDIEKTIRLNGTLMMNDKRVALINNNIYETGEMVDGYKLIDISLQGIQLEKDGEYFTIRVKNTNADTEDL